MRTWTVVVLVAALLASAVSGRRVWEPENTANPAAVKGGAADGAAGDGAAAEGGAEGGDALPNNAAGDAQQQQQQQQQQTDDALGVGNSLPPLQAMQEQIPSSPPLAQSDLERLDLALPKRIKEAEDLLARMTWQINRETSWANSVHDIIQNYQYKYQKVVANIKKHAKASDQMRELLSTLKKARLHEVLEENLRRVSRELTELASQSSETSEDEGSYAALKDRVSLMAQDLEKMSDEKVHKVVHKANEDFKATAKEGLPPDSNDTLGPLTAEGDA